MSPAARLSPDPPPRPRRQRDRGDVGEEARMIVSVSRRSHYLMKHTLAVACISLKSVWQAVCRPFLNQLRRLFAFGYLRCTSVPLRSGSLRSALITLLLAPLQAAETLPIQITDRSVIFTRNDLKLASNDQAALPIIVPNDASGAEKFAAEELRTFLSRVTGADFVLTAEDGSAAVPGIYVGWTSFARNRGIDFRQLGEEEWIIRTADDSLILTGGRPRGTLYAVYEFLEKQVGCHWLDERVEVIPDRRDLLVPPLDVRDVPVFWLRYVSDPRGSARDHWLFLLRNKNYRYDQPQNFHKTDKTFPPDAFYQLTGTPRNVHTFSNFVNAKDWFQSHPEYFALVDGERLPAYDGMGPGQLCLTHPDVLRITVEQLRKFVEQDRATAKEDGTRPPKIYNIMQNDKYDAHCHCESCRVVVEREGSESGPVVQFLNQIGESIAQDYPDIILATLAYNQTQSAPKTLRPRDNVLIAWCDVYPRSDHLRPLTHPFNVNQARDLKKWGEVSPRLGIGDDYWDTWSYYTHFPLPWTLAHCLPADIRFFADNGCETYASEAYSYLEAGKQFRDFEYWLAFHLLVDPQQPSEPLRKTFFDGYYGGASPAMLRYYDYLTNRMVNESQYMGYRYIPHSLKFLDLDFFQAAEKFFGEAEQAVTPGSLQYQNVLKERFIVDSSLLHLWPWLKRNLGSEKVMPFDYGKLLDRCQVGWKNYDDHWFNRWYRAGQGNNNDGKNLQRQLDLFRNRTKLPAVLAAIPSDQVIAFDWLTFSQVKPSQEFVADEDAFGGVAAQRSVPSAVVMAEEGSKALSSSTTHDPNTNGIQLGVDGGPTVTLKRDALPKDGKFHIYRIGPVHLKPTILPKPGVEAILPQMGTTIWALEGKRLGVFVDRVFQGNTEDPAANLWDAWISLKFSGPSFVPAATGEDRISMDRAFLVRPGCTPSIPSDRRLKQKGLKN
jgi:hypothetical protein